MRRCQTHERFWTWGARTVDGGYRIVVAGEAG